MEILSGNTDCTFWVGRTVYTSKNQKITALSVEFLSDSDFEAVLPTFCGFK